MFTRRQLLKRGTAGGVGLMLPSALLRAAPALGASPQLKAYVTNLADYMPPLALPDGDGNLALAVRRLKKAVHPAFGAVTDVWSYELPGTPKNSWLGPLIAVDRGTATSVTYDYQVEGSNLFAGSIDKSVLDPWVQYTLANPPQTPPADLDMRFMTHLHGAFVDDENDGNPEASEHELEFGPTDSELKHYPAQDRACLLWYHQHAHGLTHLNVYAGLAGGYLVRDGDDTGTLDNPLGLPADFDAQGHFVGWYEVPLVIQDRMFTNTGQLSYPPAPWVPEFFGDTLCVNGAVEPYLTVEPRLYRFRIINGCNARFLNLEPKPSSLTGVRAPMWVIGSDGGFIATPAKTPTLVIAPGERYDVIVDFSGLAGERVNLNNAGLPKSVANPAPPLSTLMQFRVGNTARTGNLPAKQFDPGATLTSDTPSNRLGAATAPARMITLEEVQGAKGPLAVVLNGRSFEGRPVKNPSPASGYPFDLDPAKAVDTEEQVKNGDIEEWNFINTTVDSHPMHMHLVQFGLVKRQPFDVVGYTAALSAARATNPSARVDVTPYLRGKPMAVPAAESSWKDTIQAHPGQVTTIKAKFDLRTFAPPQDYVYHCHILEHETNSMMRPYQVIA